MGNFATASPDTLADRYRGGIKVYLESDDDAWIIGSKWFFFLKDRCDFESADDGSGGGCSLVVQRVRRARAAGLEAFGIVDRDILLDSQLPDELRWQTDDDQLRADLRAHPELGEHIHVLRRWEIENYLLHPAALAHLISNKTMAPKPPAEDIARALISHEADLIVVTLLSTLSVTQGLSSANIGFGSHLPGGRALEEAVMKQLTCSQQAFDDHRRRVEAFAEQESAPLGRWDKLSRMLDGKRVFSRIGSHVLPQLKGVDMLRERGTLADIIGNLELVDPELRTFFGSLVA